MWEYTYCELFLRIVLAKDTSSYLTFMFYYMFLFWIVNLSKNHTCFTVTNCHNFYEL